MQNRDGAPAVPEAVGGQLDVAATRRIMSPAGHGTDHQRVPDDGRAWILEPAPSPVVVEEKKLAGDFVGRSLSPLSMNLA